MTSEWRDKSFLFRLYLNYFGFLSVNISRAVHLFPLLLFLPLLPLITLTILLINNYIINCFVEQIFFNLLIIWFKSLLLVHPADSVYQKIFKKFYLLKKNDINHVYCSWLWKWSLKLLYWTLKDGQFVKKTLLHVCNFSCIRKVMHVFGFNCKWTKRVDFVLVNKNDIY